MREPEGREIWFLNRDILVVRPKEPYVEWAHSVYDGGAVTPDITRDWVNAFLLPELDSEEEARDWLRENCDVIFELMLRDWVIVPEMWPEDRGWEAFQRWFSYERIETAWDLVDEPLSSDPPPPKPQDPLWDA
jgi:hypothetical protein